MKQTFISKGIFFTALLLLLAHPELAATPITPIQSVSDCLRDTIQHLSPEGQTTYKNLTGFPVITTKPVSSLPEIHEVNQAGRVLSADLGTQTDEVFYEGGKKCTGYTLKQGKQFCTSFKKLESGDTVCEKWDTLYEGEKCIRWEDKEVVTQVSTTVLNEMTNPGYQEALKKAQEAESQYLTQKG